MDKLSLEPGHRNGKIFKNGSKQTGRNYIDFIVSGQPLGQLFGLPDFDLIGTFGWTYVKEVEKKHINEFLGIEKPELKSGRISFYVCSECGDIGCGAITAIIEITDKTVI